MNFVTRSCEGCADEMVGIVALTVWLLLAYGTGKYSYCLWTNIQHAKRTGLPYLVGREFLLEPQNSSDYSMADIKTQLFTRLDTVG